MIRVPSSGFPAPSVKRLNSPPTYISPLVFLSPLRTMSRLQYTVPNTEEIRTCQVLEDQPDGGLLQLFKFQTFTNNRTCETDFQRFNKFTNRYETAGIIQWNGSTNAQVTFGIVTLSLRDVRRLNKPSSQSRRFRWNNSEYKWKRGGSDGKDLFCYDWRKRVIASFNDETKVLQVSERGYTILDQIVVTCLLHRWMLSLGHW